MKVLFVSNDPSILVPESAARARMKEYASAIGTLYIVTPSKNGQEVHEESLHIYGIVCSKLTRTRALAQKAHQLIVAEGIEIVSAQDPFEHGLAALKAVEGTAAKLHIQLHTDFLSRWFTRSGNFRSPKVPMPFLNTVRRRMADKVLPQASGIRVVSSRLRVSLIEQYGKRIVDPIVIPVAVSTELPVPVRLPSHPFTFALITVGRLEPEKRIEDILAALALIRDAYPAVGLFVVGEGSERARLQRMSKEKGLEQRVIFTGERPDAIALMQGAQAYIQASAFEGYGRTLIEAALARIPIITTDVGIVGEVFRGYEDVLSAPVGDPAALAAHMRALVEDSGARTELAMHAQESAKKHLMETDSSPQAIASDLSRLI